MNITQLTALCQCYQVILLGVDSEMARIAIVDVPSHELLGVPRFATTRRINIVCWTRQQMEGHTHIPQTTLPVVTTKSSASAADLPNQTSHSALTQRASSTHFKLEENHYRIRLHVDGVPCALPEVTTEMGITITARLKVLGSLDITEHRLPQDGRFVVEISGGPVLFHIATPSCRHGGKAILQLLHQVDQSLEITALGMQDAQLTVFSQALQQPQGLILVTRSTGSDKTVTLYGALQTRSTPDVNPCNVEDPIKTPTVGFSQTQIHPRADLTSRRVLRVLLRQDPDIIMMGEVCDGETAEIILKAAQTGHLVPSMLHTNSTDETLVRLQQMGAARWMIASALMLVIAQWLVRKLCPHR